MLQKLSLILLVGLLPVRYLAHDPPPDRSHADTDGPYVLYKGDKIIVRSIQRVDTTCRANSEMFFDKKAITLTCSLPQTGDVFSFPLKKNLKVEKHQWNLPDKMLVISDIEGDFEAMKRMLLMGGVINAQFNWVFGEGHVVMVGDFFDRGLNVTECLWLVYKLEMEAEAAGGKVHFILGNHEVMNLSGYTEYVRKKYLENASIMGLEYNNLFNGETELGRWLRTKNAVERIGPYVFCHGGISPELAASNLNLSDINQLSRTYLGVPFENIADADAQLVFHSRMGIFWYRGAVRRDLNQAQVDAILRYAGANHMVVGHTLVTDITLLYEKRIVAIDQFHEENVRTGKLTTLFIDKGEMFVLDTHNRKRPLESGMLAKP